MARPRDVRLTPERTGCVHSMEAGCLIIDRTCRLKLLVLKASRIEIVSSWTVQGRKEHFRELMCYMYTKRSDELLSELLPAPPPSAAQGQDAMDRYARSLAREYERAELLKRMSRVQGVWRNACAIGVFDDGLWSMLDLAWDVYGKAVTTNVPDRPTPEWDGSLQGLSFR
ncbi:hypothetical protein EVJ58_g7896 [Rhodofomes roseus]|uniref:Uncharacterized protein n=1 Tax=Rhodofomes roseus TaxID=34475 RepID=A0A4Y9Y0W9_9APHY|nr:hypothetical protein EVJ58_g7896 [Rhodofomes roseus]